MRQYIELYRLFFRLNPRYTIVLLISVIGVSCFELIAIGSFFPYLEVVASQGDYRESIVYRYLFNGYSKRDFLLYYSILEILLLAISSVFLIVGTFINNRLGLSIGFKLGADLFELYMNRDYSFFKSANLSELVSKAFNESNRFAMNVLVQLLEASGRMFTNVLIFIGLLLINPYGVLVAMGVFGTMFYFISRVVRPIVVKNGKTITRLNKDRLQLLNDGFGGIVELKVYQHIHKFIDNYRDYSVEYSRAQATNQSLQRAPRYLIEFIGFLLIICFVLYSMMRGELDSVGATLYVFGLSAYKLLPGFQLVYSATTKVKSNIDSYYFIKEEIDTLSDKERQNQNKNQVSEKFTPEGRMPSSIENFEISKLSFAYPNRTEIFSNFSIQLKRAEWYMISAPSGKGKSTLIELMLGLHPNYEGEIKFQGQSIKNNLINYYSKVGYVPQSLFLFDTSIKDNILLDSHYDQLWYDRIIDICDLEGVITQFKDKRIGENGRLLSGGQRQRVGLARALYCKPSLLFLDEATSGLDKGTLKKVLKNIAELQKHQEFTVVQVSHGQDQDFIDELPVRRIEL